LDTVAAEILNVSDRRLMTEAYNLYARTLGTGRAAGEGNGLDRKGAQAVPVKWAFF